MKSLQLMIENVLLKNKEDLNKEIEQKKEQIDIMESNINELKQFIRKYQVNKQKFTWENCKLVRLINHLNESNERYIERNDKSQIVFLLKILKLFNIFTHMTEFPISLYALSIYIT